MGCSLSKNNKVSPAGMTPCAKRGLFTNFKLWVGKKRCALFQQKVRKNQVMPLNPSPEDCHPISSESSRGTALCYTPETPSPSPSPSSSSWTTTVSDFSDGSNSNEVQISDPAINDRCRTRTIKKGSGSYQSDDGSSESSEESYHGNFESREMSPILFCSPEHEQHNKDVIKMIMTKAGIEVDDKEADRLVGVAKAMVQKNDEEWRQQMERDSDDDEKAVNLDGILRVTPIRPPPPVQREVARHDGGTAMTGAEKSGPVVEEEKEPTYANSTEELEAVINKTFKTYNLKMPEEEEKLEEKTYDDPDEELADVIQQVFRRWNIQMTDEEEKMPSTSRAVGVATNQASSSASRGPTSALAHLRSSNNGRRPAATTEATLPSRIRQARPKAAHGTRTDPTGRGFELPGSAFQRKY